MRKLLFVLSCMVLCCRAGFADDSKSTLPHSIVISGTLQTGLVAIGGETTGTKLKCTARQYELDLTGSAELQKLADTLRDKTVTVTGTMQRVTGIEVLDRWVIHVSKLAGISEAAVDVGVFASMTSRQTDVQIFQLDSADKGILVLLTSETGIGSCILNRKADQWPKEFVLQLELKGLESLSIQAGQDELKCFVPNQPPFQLHAALLNPADGKEKPLAAGDPLFPKFELTSGTRTNSYEFVLPEKLFAADPKSLSISFIDFHR